jgi:three-Cys-motif partner protein
MAERGPHTKIKLKLVGNYLTACSDVHGVDLGKFTYFETHAGDGITIVDDERIDGSPVIAANRGVNVVAMDIDAERIASLVERLSPHRDRAIAFQGDACNPLDVARLLGYVPPYYHSLGFLDPEGPGQLPFSTVLQILKHTYTYQNPPKWTRRPELLINFPLKRIRQNAGLLMPGATEPDDVLADQPAGLPIKLLEDNDAFFGTPAWRDAWLQTAHDTTMSRQALLDVYLGQIAPLFDFPPQHILIETRAGSPQYYLIFFTNKDLGDEVFQTVRAAVESYKKERWVRENMKIKLSLEDFGPRKERLTHRSLDDYT